MAGQEGFLCKVTAMTCLDLKLDPTSCRYERDTSESTSLKRAGYVVGIVAWCHDQVLTSGYSSSAIFVYSYFSLVC